MTIFDSGGGGGGDGVMTMIMIDGRLFQVDLVIGIPTVTVNRGYGMS